MRRVITSSAAETQSLGAELAQLLKPGDVVGCIGDLGAGKTCLIQGICAALAVDDVVNSPTFVLINHYNGRWGGRPLPIHHLDLYRLRGLAEFGDLGPEELMEADALCLIEWADRVEQALPLPRWDVRLTYRSEDRREIAWQHLAAKDWQQANVQDTGKGV